jgi:HTH-type transcriptional regulator/antitoxin HigA
MEAIMGRAEVEAITSRYEALSLLVPLAPINNVNEYEKAAAMMDRLLDAGGADEEHPLAKLVHTLGLLIEEYDTRHYPAEPVSGLDMLKFLMEQQNLTQADLPEIGSQGVVSEVLRGKRELNVRQIKALADRFGMSSGIFL